MKYVYLHLRSPNDTNGNPRRCFAFWNTDDGDLAYVVDEEYSGTKGALIEARQALDISDDRYFVYLGQIEVPVSEYRALCAAGDSIRKEATDV